jgi:alkylation response protein AidB-like acyl-CoA dehydrogenase
MRVDWTDEQEFLREAVAGVVTREASFTTVRSWAQDGAAAADALAARQGWTGVGLDEDLGGQGGGTLELAVLAEQLGRGAVDGRRPLAAAGERVRLVPGAAGAHELIVLVADGDKVELFAVATDAPGVTVRARTLVDRTRALADVELEDAPLRSLGTVGAGALRAAAAAAAVLVAADALGAAGRLLELTTAYVVERRQFGVPVGSFQAVKHAAAEMLVDVEASRSAVMHGAWAVGAGEEDAALHASVAKSVACAAAVRVADKALFLHGAVGYTWEHDLQLLFKRTKSDALVFGCPDMHRDLIAAGLGLAGRAAQPVA